MIEEFVVQHPQLAECNLSSVNTVRIFTLLDRRGRITVSSACLRVGGKNADVLQGMDLFILPSLFEGLLVVGVEAQMAGLPCLFADTITKETQFNEKVNFLSLEAEPQEWVNQIIRMFSLGREMVTESRIAKFNIHESVQKLEKIYSKIY